MAYRIHTLPQKHLGSHADITVTMQAVDDPLHHDLVLNARKTKDVRAITRRRDPIPVVRGYEVRRNGDLIAVTLELGAALPRYCRPTWIILTAGGNQKSYFIGLHETAREAYWEQWRQDGTAAELHDRRAERARRRLPEGMDRRTAARLDALALEGLGL
jgi:hypothetical protein